MRHDPLYEIGLVPDFHLFKDTSLTFARVRKNLESVHALTHGEQTIRGRVLDLELTDKAVQRRLTDFLLETGVDDPRVWTRRIVSERNNWELSFDKWKFKEETSHDKIFVQILQTDLQTIKDDERDEKLQNLVGQQVLVPKDRRQFKVEFETEPHPQQIQGLSYFTVQIIAKEGGAIGTAKKVKSWQRGITKSVTLDKLNNIEFEEGWHFVRVTPWTEDGDTLPLADRSETLSSERARPFESELFYVLPEGSLDEEPPQRAVPQEASLEHAKLRLQFAAISNRRSPQSVEVRDVVWVDKSTKTSTPAQPALEAKFGREGSYRISVASLLQTLESRILLSPEQLQSWRLRINMSKAGALTLEPLEIQRSAAVESFLAARSRYFASVRSEGKDLITQAADFGKLEDTCAEYAAAYRDLLRDLKVKIERSGDTDQQRQIIALRAVLSLDAVRVVVTDFRGRTREAALISPTHPMRALWFVLWSRVARRWLALTEGAPEEYISGVRDSVLLKLAPLNFPAALPLPDGRVFLSVDQIHPFWALYAPAKEEDARGLLGEVCAALSLPEPAIGGDAVTPDVLASRIERYISQHPYINTLNLNAFNAGRAGVLAGALLLLQKSETTSQLRYNIRLFVPDPELPGVGESLEQLLSPTGVVKEDADAFSISSGNHLFPKLNLAVHGLSDFNAKPEAFQSHISMLLDLFPPEEIGTGLPFRSRDTAPLHGLIQDFRIQYHDDEQGTVWQQQPRHGLATPLIDAENLVELLADLPADYSGAISTVATGSPAFEQRPITTLSLNAEQRQMLHNIHDVSDWVFTIDRNIGIEFFDHGGKRERPPYLVDYVPSATSSSGHRLIITSRSTAELKASLRQVLAQYGINADDEHAALVLNALRSLSGRLALKFASSRTHQAEALGLALARLFLERQGALSNQVILPLDAHLDLFRTIKQQATEIGETWGLQRTDLALFDLNAQERTITCNLVEVKCYKQVGSLGDYQKLKDSIAQQIRQSEEVLQRHFDPNWKSPDRPDRLLKTREISTLLDFYLERSLRYGLIDPEAAEEARILLTNLEEGYTLRFNRSAVIFDFDQSGADTPDVEAGIEFHRIGGDVARMLLIDREQFNSSSSVSEISTDTDVPLLASAAFISPRRIRTATWDYPVKTIELEDIDIEGANIRPAAFSDLEQTSEAGSIPTTDLVSADANFGEQVAIQEPATIHHELADLSAQSTPSAGDFGKPNSVLEMPSYGAMLGVQGDTPQYGIIGEASGRKVAIDLNQTHTISLFGVQGGGKSYTLGTLIETACVPIPNINVLPSPLATVIFHYSPTQDYKPEFTSMAHPNTELEQVIALREKYGAVPSALNDILILAPASKVEERQIEYPDIEVLPITFAASELKASHWKFLMGAVGSQSMYLRQINLIMRKMREALTLNGLVEAVEASPLSDHLKDLARTRLQFAAEYIDDSRPRLTDIVRPGRLIIVDLRDEFIEKDEALGLFVVLLQIFSEATVEGRAFNKLVVFDEAHKYIESPDLIAGLIEVVREMRHKGTSIMVASQDPPSVPTALIELSSQIILHKFNSPAWLRHIQKANAALSELTAEKMSRLGAGEAYVWSSKATDEGFTKSAIKIKCRPRVTQHGGSTKTAVGTDE